MEQVDTISILVPIIAAVLSAAIAYGILRNRVTSQSEDITALQQRHAFIMGNGSHDGPIFVRRTEHEQLSKSMNRTLDNLQRQIGHVRNFARWYLLTKENMSPTEVERIINGGSGG